MSRKTLILSNLLLVHFVATAWACLWDSDTLQMERQRFPGVLEIITGKFVRHSRAYYEWRIVDRQKKLATQPNDPALLDDLAVAYAKLGRPEEGIALLEPTVASRPDRYKTLSNLGTLLFFAGRLDESKDYIRRALKINPDAHFGRERYQLLLTEYLQQSERDRVGVMSTESRKAYEIGNKIVGFSEIVLREKFGDKTSRPAAPDWKDQFAELRAATKGVLGMMHFANHESPILLEALGDLLSAGSTDEDAAQHAARAYLRASMLSSDKSVADRFRTMAEESIVMQQRYTVADIESQLGGETADAAAWFTGIEVNEKKWIAESRDVDREFASTYYDSLESTIAAAAEDSKLPPAAPYDPSAAIPLENPLLLPIAGVFLAIAFIASLVTFRFCRRRDETLASKPL